jgi:hypothetical protein
MVLANWILPSTQQPWASAEKLPGKGGGGLKNISRGGNFFFSKDLSTNKRREVIKMSF